MEGTEKRRGISMYKKLMIVFSIIDIVVIALVVIGYSSAYNMLNTAHDPQKYLRNYNIFCGVAIVAVLILVTAFTISMLHTIRRGFKELQQATDMLAVGDVTYEFSEFKNDEFGDLMLKYRELIRATKEESAVAEAVANGDLTVDIEPRSDKDRLGIALRKMVEKNHSVIANINDSAYQVMTSSSQVASASEALAQGSTEQASAIEEITSSITDIADKTRDNASQASKAAELMQNAIGYVNHGNEQMHGMMNAMEDINKSSESISKIIKVIDDIAFQTNILALNAAVEAARAGDAGKGFAVVAEEVRNLAAKSAAAAAETAELIEDSIQKVSAGSKIADDTANALVTITEGVSESEKIVTEIAEASNYQATAVAQINQAINQVSQVVQTNSATSQQCAAASEQLSNQAVNMRDMLAIFDLGDDNIKAERKSAPVYRDEDIEIKDLTAANNPNEQIISLGDDFGKY